MPIMRMRAEKKMRKHLLEHLKSRKILGARIAQGEKSKDDLIKLNIPPQVYVFKNLFSGQVLYSQVPGFHQDQIDKQFIKPNWENRKPSRRNDLWRIMCVADFDSYENALRAYKGLVQLRQARDTVQQKQANSLRKKNDEGNIWYSGQYRPTYSQEAVADIAHVIDEFQLLGTTLFWENMWRKGQDSHWRLDLVQHSTLPPFNPKHQSILLDELKENAIQAFAKARKELDLENQENEKELAKTSNQNLNPASV